MIRQIVFTAISLAIALSSSAVAAGEWRHAKASMGQFEGRYQDEAQGAFITYSCSDAGASVSIGAGGNHAGTNGSLAVDGETINTDPQNYNGYRDETSLDLSVRSVYGQPMKDAFNAVILAIANGSEMTWTTADGTAFDYALSGSSDIRNCLVD